MDLLITKSLRCTRHNLYLHSCAGSHPPAGFANMHSRSKRACKTRRLRSRHCPLRAGLTQSEKATASFQDQKREGASADISVIWNRLVKLALPYWNDPEAGKAAKWRLAAVIGLTLGTTGVSVTFSFLGRDFFNALSEKDAERFTQMLFKWLGALTAGIPVFVLRDYYQSQLALEWRAWMTRKLTSEYFENQTFYRVQAGSLVDNPDQRIASDIRQFTDSALGFSLTLLNAAIDLVSFSGILYTIYPPLFVALLAYSIGGTAISLRLGRPLVNLNFQQEAQEANFRYGLVRVRENAESIAFYRGEASETRLLFQRLQKVVENYFSIIVTSRNLEFFTSFYRFLIQILPAAVVAPLYFSGKIEFGVINQSSSAFNHILSDVSLVVYQLESIAGFSAVIDRLGEFSEVVDSHASSSSKPGAAAGNGALPDSLQSSAGIDVVAKPASASSNGKVAAGKDGVLLDVRDVTLATPEGSLTLLQGLSVQVKAGQPLLIAGPSGVGKTSLLRAIAGLWSTGSGHISRGGTTAEEDAETLFLPQRPYMVLGTLRDQLLYPTWSSPAAESSASDSQKQKHTEQHSAQQHDRPFPSDEQLVAMLQRVQLGQILQRHADSRASLDAMEDWASILSLGEQQRLAFARVLLSAPKLVLMDESTSALDTGNEALMYRLLKDSGITYVSVGHRPTLVNFHEHVLRLHPSTSNGSQASFEILDAQSARESGAMTDT